MFSITPTDLTSEDKINGHIKNNLELLKSLETVSDKLDYLTYQLAKLGKIDCGDITAGQLMDMFNLTMNAITYPTIESIEESVINTELELKCRKLVMEKSNLESTYQKIKKMTDDELNSEID